MPAHRENTYCSFIYFRWFQFSMIRENFDVCYLIMTSYVTYAFRGQQNFMF